MFNSISKNGQWCLALFLFTMLFFTACKKEENLIPTTDNKNPSKQLNPGLRAGNVNPYSVENILASLEALGRDDKLEPDRIYQYYKFQPKNVDGELLKLLEAEESKHIADFPLGDPSIYNDEFGAEFEKNIAQMKDGMLYISLKKETELAQILATDAKLNATLLDELYLPNEEDHDLMIQALITSGMDDSPDIDAFKLKWPCLFKEPSGRVTYWDQHLNTAVGVPQIQVWAIFWGIPLSTFTDDNGYYGGGLGFYNAGTIMGTHAKNWRANIKPLNTTGTVLGSILSLISNFILGSEYIHGWVSSCDMKSPVNIHFGSHGQPRYWTQLLHAIKKHYDYTAADGINHAPTNLTVYAHWDNNNGSASTPMLGHISAPSLIASYFSMIYGTDISITAPNLFNLFTGLLPDVTFKVGTYQGVHYSEDLMETAFHEFGHASLFTKVGQLWWIGVISNVVSVALNGSPCPLYGCGNETGWGLTQINESWADFIGKEHHSRIHPLGKAFVYLPGNMAAWWPYNQALEDVPFFANDWINSGIFWDLRDANNDGADVIQGYSIQNMYNCFGPTINGFCDYRTKFLATYPVSLVNMNNLMAVQNLWNNNCAHDPWWWPKM